MIEDTANLQGDTGSYTAQNLMCCVLEIAKYNGKDFVTGYFMEKLDKAMKEINMVVNSLEEEE